MHVSRGLFNVASHYPHQLRSEFMNSVNTKPKSALDKQIVERLTKVTDNHRIETALPTKPVNVRNAGTPTEF